MALRVMIDEKSSSANGNPPRTAGTHARTTPPLLQEDRWRPMTRSLVDVHPLCSSLDPFLGLPIPASILRHQFVGHSQSCLRKTSAAPHAPPDQPSLLSDLISAHVTPRRRALIDLLHLWIVTPTCTTAIPRSRRLALQQRGR